MIEDTEENVTAVEERIWEWLGDWLMDRNFTVTQQVEDCAADIVTMLSIPILPVDPPAFCSSSRIGSRKIEMKWRPNDKKTG
jgi:hypothetical protein